MPRNLRTLAWALSVLLLGMRPAAAQDRSPAQDQPPVQAQPPAQEYEVDEHLNRWYFDEVALRTDKHRLDLFVPRGRTGFATLFFVHGGAWVMGDRSLHRDLGRVFARAGYGVVLPSYRLSPGVRHPAHVEDVARAFAWTAAHLADYGGDPARLVVGGHSAGGHLAALLALDPRWLAPYDLDPQRAIRGCAAISGVYQLRGDAVLRRIPFPDGTDLAAASPLTHVTAGAPPFLLLTAENDFPTQPGDADALHAALTAAGRAGSSSDGPPPSTRAQISATDHFTIVTRIARTGDPTALHLRAFLERCAGAAAHPAAAPAAAAESEEF